MDALLSIPPQVVAPILLAFVIGALAEWVLLTREKPVVKALAKSAKAIIIPALIAAYALLIADVVAR